MARHGYRFRWPRSFSTTFRAACSSSRLHRSRRRNSCDRRSSAPSARVSSRRSPTVMRCSCLTTSSICSTPLRMSPHSSRPVRRRRSSRRAARRCDFATNANTQSIRCPREPPSNYSSSAPGGCVEISRRTNAPRRSAAIWTAYRLHSSLRQHACERWMRGRCSSDSTAGCRSSPAERATRRNASEPCAARSNGVTTFSLRNCRSCSRSSRCLRERSRSRRRRSSPRRRSKRSARSWRRALSRRSQERAFSCWRRFVSLRSSG